MLRNPLAEDTGDSLTAGLPQCFVKIPHVVADDHGHHQRDLRLVEWLTRFASFDAATLRHACVREIIHNPSQRTRAKTSRKDSRLVSHAETWPLDVTRLHCTLCRRPRRVRMVIATTLPLGRLIPFGTILHPFFGHPSF